ncbi:MAG: KAP family NTPase [Kiritimatiellae bacterium]|nr:KAP family NTPase [Kiritimatiellia bacterium]
METLETLKTIKYPDRSEYKGDPDKGIWDDDISEKRESQAKALIDLIVAQNCSCTIGLNGGWGSGKTFFLTRFVKEYCKETVNGAKEKPSAIYFNAWKDDFLEDPLLSVLGQILRADGLKRFNVILEEVKSAAKPLLVNAGLELAKCVGKGFFEKVTGTKAEDIGKAIESSLADLQLSAEKDLLASYEDVCKSRDALRDKLDKLSQANWNLTQSPFVIVVDELDRCRPLFAIELLERIKHLFDIPHMVFVIGMDADQLRKSLKAVYGDINTQDYLLKFIDYETTLPPFTKDDFIYSLWCEFGYDKLTIPERSGPVYAGNDLVLERFQCLARINNLTLRQIEQCIRLFAFLARPYKLNKPNLSPELISVAIVLKVVDPEMYHRVVNWSFDIWDLLDSVLPKDALTKDKAWNARTTAQKLYNLVCAHNPKGVVRQNLTHYAVKGKVIDGSSRDDFRLPKCVEDLSPGARQKFFREISDCIVTVFDSSGGGGGCKTDLKNSEIVDLEKMRTATIGVVAQAFQIA